MPPAINDEPPKYCLFVRSNSKEVRVRVMRTQEHSITRHRTWLQKFMKLSVVSMLLVVVSACSSSSPSTVSTTLVDNAIDSENERLVINWFNSALDKIGLPNLEGSNRESTLMKLSTTHTELIDSVEMARRNPLPEVSTIGADWLEDIANSIDAIISALKSNNRESLLVAIGKYQYLVSNEKKTAIGDCISDNKLC